MRRGMVPANNPVWASSASGAYFSGELRSGAGSCVRFDALTLLLEIEAVIRAGLECHGQEQPEKPEDTSKA